MTFHQYKDIAQFISNFHNSPKCISDYTIYLHSVKQVFWEKFGNCYTKVDGQTVILQNTKDHEENWLEEGYETIYKNKCFYWGDNYDGATYLAYDFSE
jgi:hypothetical protein